MNYKSLRFRMTTWYAGLLAVALLLFAVTVYLGIRRHLNQQVRQSLIQQAKTIGEEILANTSIRGESYVVTEINESYEPEINDRFIRVTRSNGDILYLSNNPRDGSLDARKISPVIGKDRDGYVPRISSDGGSDVILQGITYTAPDGERFLIETGAPYQLIATELRGLRLNFALGIPVFLAVAILGGLVLVRNSLQPIRAITEQAERISPANISQRLPVVQTGDEIERLSLSLNRMIERLDESIQHISRFSADVSHELRTPLTILRGELEAEAIRRSHDPASLEMIGNTLEEIERLTRIVDQLLVISRIDAGDAIIERSRVHLGSLVLSTVEQMRLMAEEKLITIHCDVTESVVALGDSLRLRQVIVNILDNAIKYTPNHGSIEVAVQSRGKSAAVSITDSGIGIDPAELPHIFDRFYRADKARSRATGGTGLGLSIVKAIVVAHGGSVSVRGTEGKGTTITVELPPAPVERQRPVLSVEWGSDGINPGTSKSLIDT